jgi:hypothetical protein
MVSSKLLWNSTISPPGARFAGADIRNMYLDTPLDCYENIKIPLALLPTDIIEHYNLLDKALNGYVYVEIHKGMYGPPQVGLLLKKQLPNMGTTNNLTPLVYESMNLAPSGSTLLLMTLGSNTLERTTYNTSMMPSEKRHSKLLRTERATSTAVSTLNGTTTRNMLTSPCQIRKKTTHTVRPHCPSETSTLPLLDQSDQLRQG